MIKFSPSSIWRWCTYLVHREFRKETDESHTIIKIYLENTNTRIILKNMNSAKFGFKVRPPKALKAKYAQKSKQIDKRPALKRYAENNLHKKLEEFTYEKRLLTPKGVTIPTLQRTVKRILNCSTQFASTEKTLIDTGTGEAQTRKYSLINNSCGVHLVCPVCSEKRTRRIQAKYLPQIKELSKGKFLYSVTFTIKNTSNFLDGYNRLKKGLRTFRRMGQLNRSGESAKIEAGLYNIEILEGTRPGTYHIHAHSLFITNEQLDYSIYNQKKKNEIIYSYKSILNRKPTKEELMPAAKHVINIDGVLTPVSKISNEWYKATYGTAINIHVQPIAADEASTEKSIREILKYNSKINNMETNQIYEILRDKNGLRLFDTWGKFRTESLAAEYEMFQEESETIKVILSEPEIEVYNKMENSFEPTKRTGLLKFVNHLKDNYDELKKYRAAVNSVRAEKNKLIKMRMDLYRIYSQEVVFRKKEDDLKDNAINDIDKINMVYNMFLKWYFKFSLKLKVQGFETMAVHFMGEYEQSIMSQFMKRINKQRE